MSGLTWRPVHDVGHMLPQVAERQALGMDVQNEGVEGDHTGQAQELAGGQLLSGSAIAAGQHQR